MFEMTCCLTATDCLMKSELKTYCYQYNLDLIPRIDRPGLAYRNIQQYICSIIGLKDVLSRTNKGTGSVSTSDSLFIFKTIPVPFNTSPGHR